MDERKFDIRLLDALDDSGDPAERFAVFIRLAEHATVEQQGLLHDAGVTYVPADSRVMTARLNSDAIGVLSDMDWVVGLTLSSRLSPMREATGC